MKCASPEQVSSRPDRLLDFLIRTLRLRNDAHLSRVLNVGPPLISKIRNRRICLSDAVLLQMHDVSRISIKDLKTAMRAVPEEAPKR